MEQLQSTSPELVGFSNSTPKTIYIDDCKGKYYFDAEAVERVEEFMARYLVHFEGEFAGKSFTLLPWQLLYIIQPLFGWKRKSDGTRRFRKLSLWVGRKNGKTTLAAGIALTCLFFDKEPGALVQSAAADRKQAQLVFTAAKNMMTKRLVARATVYKQAIVVPSTFSAYHILSSDVKTKHGANPHAIIFDELHAQPNRNLYETLATGRASRRQPLFIELSTAGDDPESIAREQYDHCKKVINGVVEDETLLPVIFECEPEDDFRDPAVWAKANPSLDVTVKRSYLEEECANAISEPRKQAAFKRLHLNLWTKQESTWLNLIDWDACDQPIDFKVLEGQPCWAGLDLSAKVDLSSFVLVFRNEEKEVKATEISTADDKGTVAKKKLNLNYSVTILPFFWLPESAMRQHVKTDGVPYDLWEREGLIETTPGDVIDYEYIYDKITQLAKAYRIQEIAYDPWSATQFATQLQQAGFKMIECRQGTQTMSEPAKVFEALILSKRITHGGNKILRWCVDNVSTHEDKKSNIFPYKKSRNGRIDGVIASIMGISRLMVAPPLKKKFNPRDFGILKLR